MLDWIRGNTAAATIGLILAAAVVGLIVKTIFNWRSKRKWTTSGNEENERIVHLPPRPEYTLPSKYRHAGESERAISRDAVREEVSRG